MRSCLNGRDTDTAWASPCACAGRTEQRHQTQVDAISDAIATPDCVCVVVAEAQAALRGAYRHGVS